MKRKVLGSSFRDPSGFVYQTDGEIFRQVNRNYKDNYDHLMNSGLYAELTNKGLLVAHKEVKSTLGDVQAYKIIKPEQVPFISYPYEWSFSMLKDAALATLEIQEIALEHGMSLKDASAYNIQFFDAKPVLIDSLSFEEYVEGEPWVAYQQFCRHFLAPLTLMSQVHIELGKLSQLYIDGIPLDVASKLLPPKTRLSFGTLLHLHLHARSQAKHADTAKDSANPSKNYKVSKIALTGILGSLRSTVKKLKWDLPKTEWGAYYSATNYTDSSMKKKSKLVEEFILATKPKKVWDLGANTGKFSRLASSKSIFTVAFDIDPVAVELNYLVCKDSGEKYLLPLIQDLTNPSASIGFGNNERDSLTIRGPVDTILALALIHHLAISNNLPFAKIGQYLAECCSFLVIEFVPKSDSQVKRLLSSRKDIFTDYSLDRFREVFSSYFEIMREQKISGTERTLFLMKKKDTQNGKKS